MLILNVALVLSIMASSSDVPRAPRRNLPRIDWQTFASYETDSEFQNTYRLNRSLFHSLLEKLAPFLETDFVMAARSSSGPIGPEIMLAITLRMCAGGRYQDIRRLYQVSTSSTYKCFRKVVMAIDHVESISFPLDQAAKLVLLSQGFDALTNNILKGCIGAVDGFAICITKPRKTFCANPAAYFNRKGFYSMVFQGVCDSQRRFTFCSILCAGSTHDSVAFELTALARAMACDQWPGQFFIVGDAAYVLGENMITPYPGKNLPVTEDAFNFYQSRLRINIECAFGLLWKRWLILQSPMSFHLPFVSVLMNVLCKLHNMIITSRLDEGQIPDAPRMVIHQEEVAESTPGTRSDLTGSQRRDMMANLLETNGWIRPAI